MAIKRVKFDPNKKLTAAQIKMLREAEKRPVAYDEDNPELTEEELSEFRRVMNKQRMARRKENVTLRISQKSLAKARALGKGYTGFLSRLLDLAMEDPELIKKAL